MRWATMQQGRPGGGSPAETAARGGWSGAELCILPVDIGALTGPDPVQCLIEINVSLLKGVEQNAQPRKRISPCIPESVIREIKGFADGVKVISSQPWPDATGKDEDINPRTIQRRQPISRAGLLQKQLRKAAIRRHRQVTAEIHQAFKGLGKRWFVPNVRSGDIVFKGILRGKLAFWVDQYLPAGNPISAHEALRSDLKDRWGIRACRFNVNHDKELRLRIHLASLFTTKTGFHSESRPANVKNQTAHGAQTLRPLTAIRRAAIVGVGGLKTSKNTESGSRPVSLRPFLRPDHVRSAPPWREGEEYNTRKGNNSARNMTFGMFLGFQPPATSAVLKSLCRWCVQTPSERGLIMTDATTLSVTDINTALDAEPRVKDTRLAQALGFARPRVIRELIERNRAELERYDSIAVRHGAYRGKEYAEYWLTEGQALCLAALSNAPRAPEARHTLISVYMAFRHGQTAPAVPEPVQGMPSYCKGCAYHETNAFVAMCNTLPGRKKDKLPLTAPPTRREMGIICERRRDREEMTREIRHQIAGFMVLDHVEDTTR